MMKQEKSELEKRDSVVGKLLPVSS